MFSNNNHNNWSAAQLSDVIDSIRESNNGKCSIRMVGERIGRGEWETWQLLRDAGLHTRLYEESLTFLIEKISNEAGKLSLSELFKKYGKGWKHSNSFCCFLWREKLDYRKGTTFELVNDFKNNGYDYCSLTVAEIAEMYALSYPTVVAAVRRHGIPHAQAARGRKHKVKA